MARNRVFSAVIPTYNRSAAIGGAIESVFSQTIGDVEAVIVDDGSTDDTEDVVSRIFDDRVKYIRQDNGGGSRARNTGIDVATGHYIAFLDSDDLFLPRHLEKALPVLESGANVCTYARVLVDRGGGTTFLKPPRALCKGEHISDYLMRRRGFVQTSTLVVPRALAQKVRYDEHLRFGQDTDFALRLVAAGAELRMLDEPGAIWRDDWHPGRLSGARNPSERIAWLDRVRPIITEKAYWADMGWPVAKGFAANGRKWEAIGLYAKALMKGCYSPKMAVVVFLQVVLSQARYRKLSDRLAALGVGP